RRGELPASGAAGELRRRTARSDRKPAGTARGGDDPRRPRAAGRSDHPARSAADHRPVQREPALAGGARAARRAAARPGAAHRDGARRQGLPAGAYRQRIRRPARRDGLGGAGRAGSDQPAGALRPRLGGTVRQPAGRTGAGRLRHAAATGRVRQRGGGPMKILAIRLKNLASLAGEQIIDFTAEPLASAGLFAITGPTGAGKSTILDALCLALFGSTPRLDGASLLSKVPDGSDEI